MGVDQSIESLAAGGLGGRWGATAPPPEAVVFLTFTISQSSPELVYRKHFNNIIVKCILFAVNKKIFLVIAAELMNIQHLKQYKTACRHLKTVDTVVTPYQKLWCIYCTLIIFFMN